MIVWRRELVETTINLEDNSAKVATTLRSYSVVPDGSFKMAEGTKTDVREHTIFTEGIWIPIWLALGRGYDLDGFIRPGNVDTQAVGRFGNMEGIWTLSYDLDTLLIRKAVFRRGKGKSPMLTIETSGIAEATGPDGTTTRIASAGILTHHAGEGFAMSFDVHDLQITDAEGCATSKGNSPEL
jgi:hypothetical protein